MWYRKLTALRKDPKYADTVVYGEFVPFMADVHNLMAFLRKGEKQTLLVIGNYQKEERRMTLPEDMKIARVILDNCGDTEIGEDGRTVSLKGYQALVLELA